MCGIVGIVGARGAAPPARDGVSRATRALRHRGPDGFAFHFDDVVAFGHTRLSIIDLEHGQQPLWNEDQTVVTIYNGEIWNYLDLRQALESKGHVFRTSSDTEVLVHGYENGVKNCPHTCMECLLLPSGTRLVKGFYLREIASERSRSTSACAKTDSSLAPTSAR